jgi:CheY-like chemotaxis protein/CRP-like cAMP-binding protein
VFVCRNHLLRSLSAEDLAALTPDLIPVVLTHGDVLEMPDRPVARVYFPDSGMISIVAQAPLEQRIEIGLVGYEGMTGLSLVLEAESSPHEGRVQIPGHGHWIAAEPLAAAMQARRSIRRLFLQYAHAFAIQAAQTALANGVGNIEQRLARWIIMADDRAGLDTLPLTHEFLAAMLSVRRAGVTDAMHKLEGARLIKATRGTVTIRDRSGLEEAARGLYGVPEARYARLLGDPGSHRADAATPTQTRSPPKRTAGGTRQRPPSRAENGPVTASVERPRVLIVDDGVLVASALEEALIAAGCEVCGVASSRLLALAIAESTRPEFAVIDIELTSGDGRFVAQELVGRYGAAVLFTAASAPDLRNLARCGGLGFLSKPYEPAEVIAALAHIREISAGGVGAPSQGRLVDLQLRRQR